MGNRCIITDKDKQYQVYLQWDGELYHILGFLDGVKRLHNRTKHYQSRLDLFNFAVCIQNRFGMLGYTTDIYKHEIKDNEYQIDWDNGHYEIDFKKFEIVKLYKKIDNDFILINNTKHYKQVLFEGVELQEMIRQEREARPQGIAKVSQEIFDVNKSIFGAKEEN